MSGKKCKHCGSSEIEVDPARGDAVCTNCGTVLEDNIIVAEVEFQENAHGGASAIGQFVSAESKGGATGFGGAFNAGIGQESREVTLRKARDGITALCQQLRLNQQCIDIACNFFKMALSRHLTIGRPASHTQAACVYMTCRTEGTAHLLIDISDALQICCYQLGRTYFRLSRALCINIPPTDPCLYILRFSSQLQFEDKSHEVSMTALRLVQRMKRDSIHSGRRPSGICGAALLIAARLHNFNRTPSDVVRIVKVHESTLRKRLLEFGDTPSSALTLEEFMTVDLEEEQDPPAFRAARKKDRERLQKFSLLRTPSDVVRIVKVHESTLRKRLLEFGDTPSSALTLEEFMTVDLEEEQDPPAFRAARKKDRERLQKLMEEEDGEKEMTDLQKEIDAQLEKDNSRRKKAAASAATPGTPLSIISDDGAEDADASRFAAEDTLNLLGEMASEVQPKTEVSQKQEKLKLEKGLGPDLAVIGLGQPEDKDKFVKPEPKPQFSKDLVADELVLAPGDEEYVSSLIMSEEEARHKTQLWNKINAGYLQDQKIKEEMRAKEKEEGKDKKKKVRGSYKKKIPCSAATAGEAIEKMLAEKRISMKINYNILKTLDHPGAPVSPVREPATPVPDTKPATPTAPASPVPRKRKKKAAPATLNTASPARAPATPKPATPAPPTPAPAETVDDYDEDVEVEPTPAAEELSLGALLQNGQDDDYYDYEEY